MAKAKRAARKNKSNKYLFIVSGLFVSLIVLSGIVFMSALAKQSDTIGKYELLERIDNQACRYLDNQVGVNGGFDLNVDAPSGKPKLIYHCLTGERFRASLLKVTATARLFPTFRQTRKPRSSPNKRSTRCVIGV